LVLGIGFGACRWIAGLIAPFQLGFHACQLSGELIYLTLGRAARTFARPGNASAKGIRAQARRQTLFRFAMGNLQTSALGKELLFGHSLIIHRSVILSRGYGFNEGATRRPVVVR